MDIVDSLVAYEPGAEFVIEDDDINRLEWRGTKPKPTLEDLKVITTEQINKTKYKELRAAALGSAEEQLDFIYRNGLDAWMSNVQRIEEMYPE